MLKGLRKMKEHMQEQMFIVTVRASPGFYRYFLKIDVKGLALTIRYSIRPKDLVASFQ
jgi:hypothetical protein